MNIIITGASSGIGFETVKMFSRQSEHAIIALSRNREKLLQLVEECKRVNALSNVIPLTLDIAIKESHLLLVEAVNMHFKENVVDLLINNAGLLINKPFLELNAKEIENSYAVNIFAPIRIIQSLTPLLKRSKNPHVLNIGSMGGMNGTAKFVGLSAYSSSKAALSVLSECLAEELKPMGIRVNCLALGSVNTPMLAKAFPNYLASAEPSEIADFIVNFAVKSAKLFNGKTISVSSTTP